jgi:hypothetical protein
MFLAYIDETGDETQIMHTALLIPCLNWGGCARTWLRWREQVNRRFGIPASFEFHASDLLHGNGLDELPMMDNKSGERIEPSVKTSSGIQLEIFDKSIRTIGNLGGLRIITCHREGTDRMASYRQLLAAINEFLDVEDGHALALVDGADVGQGAAHRSLGLDQRRIVEQPWMNESHNNQFIQVADFVAYAAFQHVARQPGKQALWSLYEPWLGKAIVYQAGADAGIFGL